MAKHLNTIAKEIYIREDVGRHLFPGTTKGINHGSECPAGEDTRQRLYFKLAAEVPGLVLWYCHNCQNGGAFKVKGRHSAAWINKLPTAPSAISQRRFVENLWISAKVIDNPFDLPEKARTWILAGRRSDTWPLLMKAFVRWHEMEQAFVFPIWREQPEGSGEIVLSAVQLRYFRGHGPKCMTHRVDGSATVGQHFEGNSDFSKMLIVVEDPLSMLWTVAEAQDRPRPGVYAAYGADVSLAKLVELKNKYGYDTLIVALDNDGPQILEARSKICRRGLNLGMNVYHTKDDVHDLKYCQNFVASRMWEEITQYE